MARLLGKIIGSVINIIIIPISLILAIPMGILKARHHQKSRLLFTGEEQSLLAKAQRVINTDIDALISPDRDLLEVAKCIEDARCDYQIIKRRERFDTTFSDFVIPRINLCQVSNWDKVVSFFNLSNCTESELSELSDELEEAEYINTNDIVEDIAFGVNLRIDTREVALQFILEELDAARQGNEAAIQFVKNSGFSPAEYEGAMQKSFEEVDGPNGPQQFLLSSIMKYSSDMDYMVNLRLQVVKNIINYWGLGTQKEGKIHNLLKELKNILEDDDSVMPALTSNIPTPAVANTRHIHFSQENIDSAKNIISTLSEMTGDNVDSIIKNALKHGANKENTITEDEIFSKLSHLSDSNSVKTCRMQIIPINDIWSCEYNFSDEELETADELVSILYNLRNGDFIAPVSNIVKSSN
jgi:predicted lactoylglutathione lyase